MKVRVASPKCAFLTVKIKLIYSGMSTGLNVFVLQRINDAKPFVKIFSHLSHARVRTQASAVKKFCAKITTFTSKAEKAQRLLM